MALLTLQEHTKLSKCELWLLELIFHGHVVLIDEIIVGPAKGEAVLRWE